MDSHGTTLEPTSIFDGYMGWGLGSEHVPSNSNHVTFSFATMSNMRDMSNSAR